MITTSSIYKIIQKNDLYIIPLFSISDNGICSCGNSNCSSPGKHPFLKYNWKVIASNNHQKINKWCTNHKNLNWAVATGRKSSVTNKFLVVVDVDSNQHEILKTMPKTFGYSTGNGFHFWFWSDEPVKSSVALISDKVDVRATNGYVVIPPSKHISGRKYRFVNGLECDILPLPEEFKTKNITKTQKVKSNKQKQSKNSSTIFDAVSVPVIKRIIINTKIPDGTRNKTIFRLLCSDRSKGAEEDELISNALSYKEKCENSETITQDELTTIVSSVVKYPPFRNLRQKEFSKTLKTDFFSSFSQSKTNWISLKIIAAQYQETYNKEMDLYEAARFLKFSGFLKKRCSQGNVWGIIKNSN